jgi:hypothetical protein
VHVKAGVAIEPSGDRGMLMGGVIVGDDVDGEIARGLLIDGFEKRQPLLMARLPRRRPGARGQAGDRFALEIIERGKLACYFEQIDAGRLRRDRRFESDFLHWRVCCEPDFSAFGPTSRGRNLAPPISVQDRQA